MVPDISDASGNIDTDALVMSDPALGEAISNGLVWTVLDHRCEIWWDSLVDIGQAALNAKASVDNSEIEVMLALFDSAAADAKQGKEVNWSKAVKVALRNEPTCGPYIVSLVEYVRTNSGGGELLQDQPTYVNDFRRGMSV